MTPTKSGPQYNRKYMKKLKQLVEKRLEEIDSKGSFIRVAMEEWAGISVDYI